MVSLLLEALTGFGETLTQFGKDVTNGFPLSGGVGRLVGDFLTQFGEDVSNCSPTSGLAGRLT